MKNKIVLFLLLCGINGFSQIYFGNNAKMYVKNQLLYVGQNINLDSNSNLYLRNNSQLLQGASGVSTNTGSGTLSVYQEGTSDNFDYNYWCSPVGNASGVSGNENFSIAMLYSPTTSIASTAAIVLPTNENNGISSPLSISSKWIYKLINAGDYSQWVFVGGDATLAAGEGFSMKGTSGTDTSDPEGSGVVNNPGSAQRYDFRGKPNDGTINISLGLNNGTLTGNPYPSALDLNAFLLDADNTATGGIAYFWEQDKTVNSHKLVKYRGGYGSYSPVDLVSDGVYVAATFNSYNGDGSLNTTGSSSGLVIKRRYSPIGQGFVVSGNANGSATFKNSHRKFIIEGTSSSQFERHVPIKKSNKDDAAVKEEIKQNVSHFKLNAIINDAFTRQLALAFTPKATDGVDIGIDALNMDTDLPNDVSFWIENASYVIEGVSFEETKKIPIAVKVTTNTNFKFYIPEITNFDSSQNIYVYDSLDESYHDIKNKIYEVNLLPGVYNDRFKIAFKNETLSTSDVVLNKFEIFQDNKSQNLKAFNPNNLGLKSFKLYDMLGKTILSKKDLGTDQNFTFSTSSIPRGIYIAEFLTKNNEILTEKIIVLNSDN